MFILKKIKILLEKYGTENNLCQNIQRNRNTCVLHCQKSCAQVNKTVLYFRWFLRILFYDKEKLWHCNSFYFIHFIFLAFLSSVVWTFRLSNLGLPKLCGAQNAKLQKINWAKKSVETSSISYHATKDQKLVILWLFDVKMANFGALVAW